MKDIDEGGAGSGNFGHAGRPGEQGGSGPGGATGEGGGSGSRVRRALATQSSPAGQQRSRQDAFKTALAKILAADSDMMRDRKGTKPKGTIDAGESPNTRKAVSRLADKVVASAAVRGEYIVSQDDLNKAVADKDFDRVLRAEVARNLGHSNPDAIPADKQKEFDAAIKSELETTKQAIKKLAYGVMQRQKAGSGRPAWPKAQAKKNEATISTAIAALPASRGAKKMPVPKIRVHKKGPKRGPAKPRPGNVAMVTPLPSRPRMGLVSTEYTFNDLVNKARLLKEGGAGSGNFGHAGRPGEQGGSGPGGGSGTVSAGGRKESNRLKAKWADNVARSEKNKSVANKLAAKLHKKESITRQLPNTAYTMNLIEQFESLYAELVVAIEEKYGDVKLVDFTDHEVVFQSHPESAMGGDLFMVHYKVNEGAVAIIDEEEHVERLRAVGLIDAGELIRMTELQKKIAVNETGWCVGVKKGDEVKQITVAAKHPKAAVAKAKAKIRGGKITSVRAEAVDEGGAGSGNFGHAGRPGEQGGSGPGGDSSTVSGGSGAQRTGKWGSLPRDQKLTAKQKSFALRDLEAREKMAKDYAAKSIPGGPNAEEPMSPGERWFSDETPHITSIEVADLGDDPADVFDMAKNQMKQLKIKVSGGGDDEHDAFSYSISGKHAITGKPVKSGGFINRNDGPGEALDNIETAVKALGYELDFGPEPDSSDQLVWAIERKGKFKRESISAKVAAIRSVVEGGAGSGNFGHAGRPGEVGGSGPGGGSSTVSAGAGDRKTTTISKDDHVHYDEPDAEFAKMYTKHEKAIYEPGTSLTKDNRIEGFRDRFKVVANKNSFAGSGRTMYQDTKTGDVFLVNRMAGGKSFYDTVHSVSRVAKNATPEKVVELKAYHDFKK